MWRVVAALLPALGCGLYYFGLPAAQTLVVCVAACVAIEWAITRWMLRRPSTISDGSAVITGILLAMNLPATLPWWMSLIGAFVAIGIAKMAFGGLGCNIFNPALVGRIFLLVSFPVAMTTWIAPDGTTGPTILGALSEGLSVDHYRGLPMALGDMAGSMGETASVAILVGLLFMLVTRVITWHIPVAILGTVVLFDLAIGFPPMLDLLSGGLLLGAVFMATDYVTSPVCTRGMLVYGVAIGVITVVIRRWGAYPEGMSFAIVIMNGFVPLINRYVRPRRFSPRRKEVRA